MDPLNKELHERLIRYLDVAEKAIGNAAEFAAAEIPDVARQWLVWEFWVAVLLALAAFGLLLVIATTWRKVVTWFPPTPDKEAQGFLAVIAMIVVLAIAGFGASRVGRAVKVAVAPKVVLIEGIADLVKGQRK